MGGEENVILKPGTVLLAVFMISLGLIMFNWTSGFFQDSDQKAEEDRKNLEKCSGLNIDIVDVSVEGDNVTTFFSVNKQMKTVYVNFEGYRNVTKSVENVAPGSLRTASAKISNISEVYFKAKGCSQVFRR